MQSKAQRVFPPQGKTTFLSEFGVKALHFEHRSLDTFPARKKVHSEVCLALHCPGVETYLDTEKKHSFTHSFFPATQLSPLRVGCLVGCHVGCCVVVPPPPSAPRRRRHRRHRRRSASRMMPATRTPTAAPTWVWSPPYPTRGGATASRVAGE